MTALDPGPDSNSHSLSLDLTDDKMDTAEEATPAPSSSSSSAAEWKVPIVKTVMPLSDVNIRYGAVQYSMSLLLTTCSIEAKHSVSPLSTL